MDNSRKRGFSSSVDSPSVTKSQDDKQKEDAERIARAIAIAAKLSAIPPPPEDEDDDVPPIDDSAWISVNENNPSYQQSGRGGPPAESFKRARYDSQEDYPSHSGDRRSQNSRSPPRGGDHHRKDGRQQDGKITESVGVPNQFVGLIIGRKGDKIRELESLSGASIAVTPDSEADPRSKDRQVTVSGTPAQVNQAKKLIFQTWSQDQGPKQEQKIEIKIPSTKVGLIIGKGGQTIKELKAESGAHIQVSPRDNNNPGAPAVVTISARNGEAVELAKKLIEEKISQGPPGSNYQEGGSYGRGGGRRGGPSHYGDSGDSYSGSSYNSGYQENYYGQENPNPRQRQPPPPQQQQPPPPGQADQQYYQGYSDYYNQYGGQYPGQYGNQYPGQYGGQYGGYPDQSYYGQQYPAESYQQQDEDQ